MPRPIAGLLTATILAAAGCGTLIHQGATVRYVDPYGPPANLNQFADGTRLVPYGGVWADLEMAGNLVDRAARGELEGHSPYWATTTAAYLVAVDLPASLSADTVLLPWDLLQWEVRRETRENSARAMKEFRERNPFGTYYFPPDPPADGDPPPGPRPGADGPGLELVRRHGPWL